MDAERTVDVPVLLSGWHEDPRRGACLMEVVSALPGGPWTDRPRLVPPVLAAACRTVNDHLPTVERASLLSFVPWISMGRPPPAPVVEADLNERLARLAESYTGRTLSAERVRRPRAAARVVKRAVRSLGREPDAANLLRDLLLDAVNMVRVAAGLEAVAEPDLRVRSVITSLPMEVTYRRPDDSLSAYVHCAADLAGWPPELIPAWLVAATSDPVSARGPW